jgi:hypothetical protein
MKNLLIDNDFEAWLQEKHPLVLTRLRDLKKEYIIETSEPVDINIINKCKLKRMPEKCCIFPIGNSGCEGCGHKINK